ncbi:DUF2501 domain-containing protein [Sphingomonas rubra]|uniref:DUF2501 domain-containing protein n=1 Tax=Sphingomonas rubra TaxID=634430 RepID=A0A1I5QKK4_9SPHN|nr:DUF2501 domain-containing protein [Sphingomonas rubra]SFP46824.1 Protein of unknown function [Sphingomonas rubra]
MFRSVIAAIAVAGLAAGASAQTSAPSSGLGGLGGLLGGGLPNIASVGAGNAAGLLGYCLKNNLLGAAGVAPATPARGTATSQPQSSAAQSILERLTGRQGVATSPGFAAGQAGQVQTGGGQALSLDGLRGQIKTRVCSAVLSRARSFL